MSAKLFRHKGFVKTKLVSLARLCAVREETPSLVSVDSQSQSAEPGHREGNSW